MHSNAVRWFEIYVQDMPRARAFYEGVLGVSLEQLGSPEIEMWAFGMDPEKPGTGGALVRAPGVPSGNNSTLVYFGCEDCAVEESRVETFGGKVHRPRMSIGQYGFISLALDPDGNLVGFHSMS
jgi:predicted enzyme related to lactoylglutathione lyase